MIHHLDRTIYRTLLNPIGIYNMHNSGDEIVSIIAKAIQAGTREKLSSQEQEWINKIEELRTELTSSNEMLDSWVRPWLKDSPELQKRLKNAANSEDHNYKTAKSIAQACAASKPPQWCLVLFALVRHLKPQTSIELGTNLGISGAYIAAALAENKVGKLLTIEGSLPKANLAEANLKKLQLDSYCQVIVGDFRNILPNLLSNQFNIDLAFIDGFHDGIATVDFHQQLKSTVNQEAVFVYDDINWSDGMSRAWNQIRHDHGVAVSIDFKSVGICVIRPQAQSPKHYSLRI